MFVRSIEEGSWPQDRGSRAGFRHRFGDDCGERFEHALQTGDPPADALVAVTGARGNEVRRQFVHGLLHGLASLEAPDEVVADLLGATERPPTPCESALIATGPRSWCDVPYRLHLLSMSAGALIEVYASPSIASVLTATGQLNERTDQRLRKTARWLSGTMLPGSLAVGQAGYVATVRLRVLHARARHAARRHGHDERRFGIAINQVDLSCTWLAFTLTRMRAEALLGFAPSDAAIAENYRYWQRLAHLLGIDETLVGAVRDHADAERLERRVNATSGAPGQVSARLTARTLAIVAGTLDGMSAIPGAVPRRVLETLVRRVHGDARADALEIGHTPGLAALMAPVTALARLHRATRGDSAERWTAANAGRYADALAVALADRDAAPPPEVVTGVPLAATLPRTARRTGPTRLSDMQARHTDTAAGRSSDPVREPRSATAAASPA